MSKSTIRFALPLVVLAVLFISTCQAQWGWPDDDRCSKQLEVGLRNLDITKMPECRAALNRGYHTLRADLCVVFWNVVASPAKSQLLTHNIISLAGPACHDAALTSLQQSARYCPTETDANQGLDTACQRIYPHGV